MDITIYEFFSKPKYLNARKKLAPLLVLFEKYIAQTFQSSLEAKEGYFNFEKFYAIYPDLYELTHEEIDKQLQFIGRLRNKTIHSWSFFSLPNELEINKDTMDKVGNFIRVSAPFYVDGILSVYGMLNLCLSLFPETLLLSFSRTPSLYALISPFFSKDLVATGYPSIVLQKKYRSGFYSYPPKEFEGKQMLLWILFKEKGSLVKERTACCSLDLGDYMGSNLHNDDPYNGLCLFKISESDDEYIVTIMKGSFMLTIFEEDFIIHFEKRKLHRASILFSRFGCFDLIVYCRKKNINTIDEPLLDSIEGNKSFYSECGLWKKVCFASERSVSTDFDVIDHFAFPAISFFVTLEALMAKDLKLQHCGNATFGTVLNGFCPSLPNNIFKQLVSCRNAVCHGSLVNESCSNGYEMNASNVFLSLDGFLKHIKGNICHYSYGMISKNYSELVVSFLSNKYLRALERTVQILFDKNGKEKETDRKNNLKKIVLGILNDDSFLTFKDEGSIDLSVFEEPLHLSLAWAKVNRLGIERTDYPFNQFYIYHLLDCDEYYFYTDSLFEKHFASNYEIKSQTKKGLCNIVDLKARPANGGIVY